jgi:hypothetical protein
MKHTEKEILNLFDQSGGIYTNPHEVELTLLEEEVCMSISWPDMEFDEDIMLEVVHNSPTISHFIKEIGLTSSAGIDNITPSTLMNMYHLGKACVFCLIDQYPGFSMYFRRQNNKLIAMGDCNINHVVPVCLQTPEQFISYTLQHYRLLKAV